MKTCRFTSLTKSPGTAAVEWFLIMNLLSVQLQSQKAKRTSTMRYTRPLTSAKTWCPSGPDTPADTSV